MDPDGIDPLRQSTSQCPYPFDSTERAIDESELGYLHNFAVRALAEPPTRVHRRVTAALRR